MGLTVLDWARREASLWREATKHKRPLRDVRASRATEDASVTLIAEALQADPAQIRRAHWREPGTMKLATKFGPLHMRPQDTDLLVIKQIFVDGEYDFSSLAQMSRLDARYRAILEAGRVPVFIDGGGNIGAASVWFAKRFPEAAFIIVEPDPANATVARLNAAELPNARVAETALGSAPGRVALTVYDDQGWGSRTQRSDSGVEIVTIPDLVASVPNGTLFIAKIDIEGFESDVFAANLDWIDEADAIMIEPHDWMMPGAGTSQSFQSALLGKGFEILIAGENLIFVR